MTFDELRYEAAQSYIMALACNDTTEIDRFYEQGDRYNDMADAMIEHAEPSELELA